MCKGMEEYALKTKIEGAIMTCRVFKMSDEEIIKIIVNNFHVTAEYVKSIMESKPA